MILYVLMMRISAFSVLKFGITEHPRARMSKHERSSRNPFGVSPGAFVIGAWFSRYGSEARDLETRLRRASVASYRPCAVDRIGFDLVVPRCPVLPSGEWLCKRSERGDGFELVDAFNRLAAHASLPDLLFSARSGHDRAACFDRSSEEATGDRGLAS